MIAVVEFQRSLRSHLDQRASAEACHSHHGSDRFAGLWSACETPTAMHPPSSPPSARVVLLGGPSGAGKTRLADRTGLPIVRLDDFYREGDDPALPRSSAGVVDWDDARSWDEEAALAALSELCRTGAADVPIYDIAHDGVVGTRRVVLGDARLVVAEGIFAAEIIAACRERDLLAAALCVRQNRYVTWWRRLVRDVRERRKPVPVLVRRGWHLLRLEPAVIERHVQLGAVCVSPAAGARLIAGLPERVA